MTRPYAEVIGDPIAHSKSPLIHNFWLTKLRIDAEYRACHVRPDELADYFPRRRGDAAWRGCNVTIPHKIAAMAYADTVDYLASSVGATNTVWREDAVLNASNTDLAGVEEAMPALPLEWSIAVIGAGGAARAALAHLAMLFGKDLRLVARDATAASQLAGSFGFEAKRFSFADAGMAFEGAHAIINTTPLGMVGQPEMPREVLTALAKTDELAGVFDMVYAPLDTPLLQNARAIGRRTSDGLQMLVGQAAQAFEHFFGQPAPRQYDAELRALLTA